MPEKAGLLWIGEEFYKTPEDFNREAGEMGISRRITSIPRGYEIGKTWVFLAHRKTIETQNCKCDHDYLTHLQHPGTRRGKKVYHPCSSPGCECKNFDRQYRPAIFRVIRPTHVERVVKGDEPEEELEKLQKRGIELVIVEKKGENGELPLEETVGESLPASE
jgi:hypothetical protein